VGRTYKLKYVSLENTIQGGGFPLGRSTHQIGRIVGPEISSDVMITVFAVMSDMKVVLNVPLSVAGCGRTVIGLFPLLLMVN
jgi:hypothetical protein